MGVPLMRTKLWAYAVGAVAGGVGGVRSHARSSAAHVDTFNFQFSVIVLCDGGPGRHGQRVGRASSARVVLTWINSTGMSRSASTSTTLRDLNRLPRTSSALRARPGADDAVPARRLHPPACSEPEAGQQQALESRRDAQRPPQDGCRRHDARALLDARGGHASSSAASSRSTTSTSPSPRGDRRADRPQRRGQDHVLQRAHRPLPAHYGERAVRRPSQSPACRAAQDRRPRHGPHLPEHPAVRHDDGSGERHGGDAPAPEAAVLRRTILRLAQAAPRGARGAGRSPGSCSSSSASAAPPTSSPRTSPYGDQRRLEVARALGAAPEAAAARRADGRHEPAGVGALHRVRPRAYATRAGSPSC